MEDQLNFGKQYVSEASIIKKHFQKIGARGGRVKSERKTAANRISLVKARQVRGQNREHEKSQTIL